MSNSYKDRVIRIEDIPTTGKRLLEQNLKPYLPLFILLGGSVLLMIGAKTRFVGIALACIILYVLFGTRDRKLLLISDKFIVSYAYNQTECTIYYLDEIVLWRYRPGQAALDKLELQLSDGSNAEVDITYPNPVLKVLREVMAERESKPLGKKRW